MAHQPPTQQKQWGITQPISTALPTDKEKALTASLIKQMESMGCYESREDAALRERVLGQLNRLVKEFVKRASMKHGLTEAAAAQAGGKIFTFGSYRLGVHGPGADIDTLVVAPRHVPREEFFETFYDMLKEREEVTELTPVPGARVPVINLRFLGVYIDLLFARLALPTIPDTLELKDDNLLRNLDERCVFSVNGSRVTDEILRLVPNKEEFRTALRAIKKWAKCRAIYSNVMGFPGGVAWAMLVARICQLYPNACAGTLVSRFFLILLQWNWPHPVLLSPIAEGPLPVRVWNPKLYATDRTHRMPIITPAYPAMCATHNVTASTMAVMLEEFQRASTIVEERIVPGLAEWKELFEGNDFFYRYRYYLQIIASALESEAQRKWAGTVESKVRTLVLKLENLEDVEIAQPFVDSFERTIPCKDDTEANAVMSGDAPNELTNRKVEDFPTETDQVHTSSFFIGLKIRPRVIGSVGPRKLDITHPTQEFHLLTKSWDGYEEKTMSVAIRYIKSSALPDYVFEKSGGRKEPPAGSAGGKKKKQKNKTPTPFPDEQTGPTKKARASSYATDPVISSTPAPGSVPPLPTANTALDSPRPAASPIKLDTPGAQ